MTGDPAPNAEVRADPEVKGFFGVYAEYAKTLRAWLVAYGVGGPVLFATNDAMAARVGASAEATVITYLFLGAVAAQVFIAVVNKWAAWFVYLGIDDEDVQKWKSYRTTVWLSRQAWIDMLVDVGSIAALFWATAKVLAILTAGGVAA